MIDLVWLQENWVGIAVWGAIAVLVIWKIIKKMKERNKSKKVEYYAPISQENMFGKKDTLSILREQKKEAEENLRKVKEEGKSLLEESKKVEDYCNGKRAEFNLRQNDLGLRYGTWEGQLQLFDKMIENQKKREEALRR